MKKNYVYEEWRPIMFIENGKLYDYTNLYEVSNFGRIKSLDRIDSIGRLRKGKIIKQKYEITGYLRITLHNNSKPHFKYVQDIVAFAFPEICGEWFEGAECNHKGEIKDKNYAWQLEWCTKQYNCNYGTRNERIIKNRDGKTAPKIIFQCDNDYNIINEFSSVMEVERILGFDHRHICDCCNGKRKTANGYKWKYKQED